MSVIALLLSPLLYVAAPLTGVEDAQRSTYGVELLNGDWQILDTNAKRVMQNCDNAQRFTVSADGRTVDLVERGVDDWSMRYRVIHQDGNRVLLFVEGEERLTDAGDPVLWWAYFDDEDGFRWRRYDWDPASRSLLWKRCPKGTE